MAFYAYGIELKWDKKVTAELYVVDKHTDWDAITPVPVHTANDDAELLPRAAVGQGMEVVPRQRHVAALRRRFHRRPRDVLEQSVLELLSLLSANETHHRMTTFTHSSAQTSLFEIPANTLKAGVPFILRYAVRCH